MLELKNFFGTAEWEDDEFVLRLPLDGFVAAYKFEAENAALAEMPTPELINIPEFKRLIERMADDTYRHVGERETGQTHLHDWADALIEMAQEDPDITAYAKPTAPRDGEEEDG